MKVGGYVENLLQVERQTFFMKGDSMVNARKIIKEYDDGAVFILNVKRNIIDYYEGDSFMFSIINIGSISSFVHKDTWYEKIKGFKPPDIRRLKLCM